MSSQDSRSTSYIIILVLIFTRFPRNSKQLTSSKCRKIFDPNHQVNLGEGYPPTAWQVTSISLSADKWLILSKIETPVGFTEKQNTLFSLEHVFSIAYIFRKIHYSWGYNNNCFSIHFIFSQYFILEYSHILHFNKYLASTKNCYSRNTSCLIRLEKPMLLNCFNGTGSRREKF